jgi:Leucine-rich repeat (LRR) protein
MTASSFVEYASSPNLSEDEIYTIELLIDHARVKCDENYWDDWSERDDAREAKDYQPSFSKEHLHRAAHELMTCSSVSVQRLREAKRPVRDVTAFRFLPALSWLILQENEINDIGPLRHCRGLRTLSLSGNPIRDISALEGCPSLEELNLIDAPVHDLSPLSMLRQLKDLTLSTALIPKLRQLSSLPVLRKLYLHSGEFDSFEGLPGMPELRIIERATVDSLSGLQRYPNLENLVCLAGKFDSLEPLRTSKQLTHIDIIDSRIRNLQPLSSLAALRELRIETDCNTLDLGPLDSLPALHEVRIVCDGKEPTAVETLRMSLTSWDLEFLSKRPKHTPSLTIEVVDQKTFDYYDTQKRFGIIEADTNEGLLASELAWLDNKLDAFFSVDFSEGKDYTIPSQFANARSRTVVLLSERAVEAFSQLALGIQEILCHVKRDWIVYFQHEEGEFTVWVYAHKIVVTEEHAERVRELTVAF